MTASAFLDPFSPQQREGGQAGEGPLSILAGPGSGKTTALAGRIAYLVGERGVSPSSVLAITFPRAAAATLRQRLAGVLGERACSVDIATFHALGLRIVRQWSAELGFGLYPPAVYGRDDARAVLREVARDIGLELAPERGDREADPWSLSAAKLANAVERFRLRTAEASAPWDDPDGLEEELVRQVAEAYEARLRERGAVDYASMLALPLQLLRAEPPALRVLQDAYRFVMLDEAQDTCHTQHALLRLIVKRHHNLMVVGDPQQCVFSWRGADPKILLDFPQTYPGARVIVLNENHRSTGVIVALANAVAAPLQYRPASWTHNPAGPRARVYGAADEADEARFVAAEIRRLLQSGELAHPGQAAVLFRTNPQARALALALRAEGIPFRVRADADLFGRPEVRDLVAYLRLAHSPTDGPALARIINTPPRRLRLVEQALRRRPVAVVDLPRWAQKRGGPPARRAVETLLASLDQLHQDARGCRPVRVLELILERTGYAVWLATQQDGPTRLGRIEELHAVLEGSPAPDLATWLADWHLGEADGPADGQAEAVALTTIHSAKGAEWPVVFVVGLEEGLLPHGRPARAGDAAPEDDEERRLTHVAFSRPQVLLYLTYCRTRRPVLEGQVRPAEPRRPSRFLHPLPAELIHRVA